MIRQLESLTRIMEHTTTTAQRDVLLRQAAMILRESEESVPEPLDRLDVRRRYDGSLRSRPSAPITRTRRYRKASSPAARTTSPSPAQSGSSGGARRRLYSSRHGIGGGS